jgi:DNA-binding GntR family transcriptional regulator
VPEATSFLRDGWSPPIPESLPDSISRHLQSQIMSGSLAPGVRLRQEELCQAFGVSRTPIREALRQLQAEGLVNLVPNRGATVRGIRRDEVVELYQVRAELEGLAGALAAPRIAAEALNGLRATVVQAAEAVSARPQPDADPATTNDVLRRTSHTFHRIVYEQSGNAFLCETLTRLFRSFPRDYVWSILRQSGRTGRIDFVDHDDIVAALEARDVELTRARMRQHTLEAGRQQIEYLDEKDFWSTGNTMTNPVLLVSERSS